MQQPPPLPSVNPYAAPTARVLDPVQTDQQELADRGTRLLAAIVDGVIYGVAIMLFAVLVPIFAGNSKSAETAMIIVMGLVVITLLVVDGVLLHKYGQTIAKRLFKIKIVRSDGSRCSLPRVIFARWLPVALLKLIPLVNYLIMLVDPLLIFRDDYRCMHDLIADTVVVKA